jgi:CBS-domain-containing membrane protein
METVMVGDLMVPLEEYATVSEDATLFDAVMALEKAQERLDRESYHYLHRAILVLDKNKRVIGKVSQLDALRTLEPKYAEMGDWGTLSRAGFSPQFMKSMVSQYALLTGPLEDICKRAAKTPVKEFMYTPREGEYIDKGAYLNQAIHQFVMGHHQSLLVTKDQDIVGVLRLTDVFKHVFQIMKTGIS